MDEQNRNKWEKTGEWYGRHPVWGCVILFLPTIWFPIVIKLFGEKWHLADANGTLTPFGWFVTVVVYIGVLFVIIVKTAGEKAASNKATGRLSKKMEKAEASATVYAELLLRLRNFSDNKFSTLLTYVKEKDRLEEPLSDIITAPKRQIVYIADELKNIIYSVSKSRQVTVTVAYRNKLTGKKWAWADERYGSSGGLSLEALSTKPNTTFFEVSNDARTANFAYYNSKKEAEQNSHYIPDSKDGKNPNGSIICYYISVPNGFIDAVVSIATYGGMLVADADEKNITGMRETLKDSILPEFESRILHELLLLYIEESKSMQRDKDKVGAPG